MSFKGILAAVLLGTLVAPAANAASITYDFRQIGSDNFTSRSYTEGGLTVTVEAQGGFVDRHISGLGVFSGTANDPNDANKKRVGEGEALVFSFAPQNIIAAVTVLFETKAEDEPFRFSVNGFTSGILSIPNGSGSEPGFSSAASFQEFNLFNAAPAGTIPPEGVNQFTMLGVGNFNAASDHRGLRVAGLTVETVQAIPLPAGVLLMLTGLSSLGLVAFRRRRATA